MKKILNVIILLLSALIITGCTAEYKITVGKNINEDLTIKADTKDEYETLIKNQNDYPINKYYNDKNLEAYVMGYQNKVSYYDFEPNDSNLTLNYKSNFSLSKAKTSNIVNKCFENYEIIESKDELYISAGEEFQCLKNGLDVAKIILITDYEIIYSNADSKSSNELTWYINSNNYKNKSLKVNLYKKVVDDSKNNNKKPTTNPSDNKDDNIKEPENNKKETNYPMILAYILLGILVLIGITLILFQKKSNNNRI